ncbi:MAG: ATP synthase F0 subunit A [Candidatus Brocadia sp. AMX2]|uniref:ATP synthase subunit a n=1 Tax=Candidatus Brocadia sinica JPN1 TaxID=1197129 RepID=A0ABQ0JZ42_9BACT|nr:MULTISPECIES: F0F1 ATP synthase subunit A [Brocadia]KXK30890.1 MAG: F0F1 ATP synthase A subunit [Candidatus Brocadia sinica]MBC6931207.1 ATP synthase F0 subunit A [Candidatus Brocadia sp.]MBL1168622.1 ATP synthase F0 subunit A [Candidatus Brocadia sp. AMX1]NOG40161.1 F0F1 ATP synthase subunit A [Planctomycetota bacterium]KAA0246090.1 MAG: ATP synthase F0 subunit A [Candidatus Brocadia sp. AMX2]
MSGAGGETESSTELPSFVDFVPVDAHSQFFGLTKHEWVPIIMSATIIIFLGIFSILATRRLRKVPGKLQSFLEIVVEGLENFTKSQMGRAAGPFIPFIGTLFIYIFAMNMLGQIPLFHSPTSNFNTTIALTLIVFFVTHYQGVKNNGIVGYLKHMGGKPIWLAPLVFPLHLMQELLSRPLSLSMRLFGNVMGEDTIIAIFIGISPFLLGFIPLPMHLPMVFLALLGSTIQAMIFSLLASFYIAGAIGIHEDEHH